MSIKKNFIYNVSYQILIIILPLITTPYVSRIIGPEGIGIQSYTYSIASYFALVALLGINNHGNRSVAMVRENREKLSKTFMSIYIFQVFVSILAIIGYIFYVIFIVDKYKILFFIQLIYLLVSLLEINWFFFGMEEFKLTVIRNIIIKLISVCSIFLFVKDSDDLYTYALILALGSLTSQLVLWGYIGKYIDFVKVDMKDILLHVKPILILFIPVIAMSIYKIMDKIMLGSMSNIVQVGFYENSEKIINIPKGLIAALGTVMLPKMSNLYANNDIESSKEYIKISIEFAMFIAVGAMFGLIGVGPILVPIFLGEKFAECIPVVSLLSVTLLFLAWANVIRTQYLIPRKQDNIYIYSTIFGAIVNVIVNILLIKKYGAVGAAIGTIFAEGMVSIYQTLKVRTELPVMSYIKSTLFYFIPGFAMYIVLKGISNMMPQNFVTGIVQILVGGIIYIGLCLVYLIITKNDYIMEYMSKVNKKLGW